MSPDTAIEGQENRFPSTLWSNIVEAGDQDADTRRAAWEELAARYWKPVFVYIRSRWSRSPEEAIDLTQEFFAWMMESGFPSRADPRRGRFRGFIRSAVESFLKMEARGRRRQKRGGGKPILSLDDLGSVAIAGGIPAIDGLSPEAAFERMWKRELLVRATKLLMEKYRARGKETYYEVFRASYFDGSPGVSYEDLATRFGITTTDVSNFLMDTKRTLREILMDLIAETVGGTEDLHNECRELFGEDT